MSSSSRVAALYRRKRFFLAELLVLIILPLNLLFTKPAIIHTRTFVMVAALAYVYWVYKALDLSPFSLGFARRLNLTAVKGILPVTIIALLAELLVFFFAPQWLLVPAIKLELVKYTVVGGILGYIFISSPVQEILFRSFFLARAEGVVTPRYLLILLNAVIFGAIHLPLNNLFLAASSFILGIFWADNFLKHRCFGAVWLSHAAIGSLLILANGL